MSASARWEGLDELKAGLRQTVVDLTAQADRRVRAAALDAQEDIARRYPSRTGHLRRNVRVVGAPAPAFGAALRVHSRAAYARFVDARLDVLGPAMARHRAQLERDLADDLRRAGFEVRAS